MFALCIFPLMYKWKPNCTSEFQWCQKPDLYDASNNKCCEVLMKGQNVMVRLYATSVLYWVGILYASLFSHMIIDANRW